MIVLAEQKKLHSGQYFSAVGTPIRVWRFMLQALEHLDDAGSIYIVSHICLIQKTGNVSAFGHLPIRRCAA